MTRLNHISQADLESINAYLDAALSPKEKADFEKKLSKSLPLQAELREYTILRNQLRSLPAKKAPHHFTLTAAEAREIRAGRKTFLAPVFNFASLVSVMLLAIVFASDWIFKNMSAPALPAESVPLVAAVAEPSSQPAAPESSTDAPILFNWGSGGYGLGGADYSAKGSGGGGMDTRVMGSVVEEFADEPALGLETASESPQSEGVEEAMPKEESDIFVPEGYAGAVIWGLQADRAGEVLEVYPNQAELSPAEAVSAQQDIELAPIETSAPYQTSVWVKVGLAGSTILFAALAYFFQKRFG